jgi:hypothetical protein
LRRGTHDLSAKNLPNLRLARSQQNRTKQHRYTLPYRRNVCLSMVASLLVKEEEEEKGGGGEGGADATSRRWRQLDEDVDVDDDPSSPSRGESRSSSRGEVEER